MAGLEEELCSSANTGKGDCQLGERSNSRDGADGGADGCLTPLPFSVASAREERKTAASGTARRRNQQLSSPQQSTEVVILARQQLVGAPSSAIMAASRLDG